MRDFYKEYNLAFQKHWQAEGKEPLQIQKSHFNDGGVFDQVYNAQ